ncbi:MAG: right-handed parallel beta-helix repeat-containing protein [Planctomycetota bacterium]|jgi:hypothetical protein
MKKMQAYATPDSGRLEEATTVRKTPRKTQYHLKRQELRIASVFSTWLAIFAFFLVPARTVPGRTITVDDDRPADFDRIQAAIDDAVDWDVIEVWPGTYRGPGNRDIDFRGKAVTVRSIDPNEPNIVAAAIVDCNGTWDDPHRGFHFHSAEDANSVLDGLTIKHGYAVGAGGGILGQYNSSPTIRNCLITGNEAEDGAGIYGCDGPITNCTIMGNYAYWAGGGLCTCNGIINNCWIGRNGAGYFGGGLAFCNARIVNCVITGNDAANDSGGGLCACDGQIIDCTVDDNFALWGGGFYFCDGWIQNCRITGNLAFCDGGGLDSCQASIANCLITANRAWGFGGGISYSNHAVTNSTINGNWAYYAGGGLCGCNGAISNCTISGDSAYEGGGLYLCEARINNCVIWDNRADNTGRQLYLCAQPNYSCVQDWPGGGVGNIIHDPCFADPGYWDDNNTPHDPYDDFWVEGDYHLQSQAGRWNPNVREWVIDAVTSPCIDAGDPNTPVGGEPEPNGNRVNMGAYGQTAEASLSFYGAFRTATGYTPGWSILIVIEVNPRPAVTVYALEDIPPDGWTVGDISEGGVWDGVTKKVKWGPFFDNISRTLTYELSPPVGAAGCYPFSGVVSFDGASEQISGDNEVCEGIWHPADSLSMDWRMVIDEVTSYGSCWKSGCAWPVEPNPIPIRYVTRAGYLWRCGEYYHFDCTCRPPRCWRPDLAQSSLPDRTEDSNGPASSSFTPPNYAAGSSLTVRIEITPQPGTQAYAVEDTPPPGWVVANISDAGAWDSANKKVKWGLFFDENSRTFSYDITPTPGQTGAKTFSAIASFDGGDHFFVRGISDLVGDFSLDGKVDYDDLSLLTMYWLNDRPALDVAPPAGDRIINLLDFVVFGRNWLAGAGP